MSQETKGNILSERHLADIKGRVEAALPETGFDPRAVWFEVPKVIAEVERLRQELKDTRNRVNNMLHSHTCPYNYIDLTRQSRVEPHGRVGNCNCYAGELVAGLDAFLKGDKDV